MNFNPSCTWRAVVAVRTTLVAFGIRVPWLLKGAAALGVAKFARLNRLKISRRNWMLRLATIVFLKSDRSTIFRSGPRSELRPTLPYSPFGGSTNALALNQLFGSPVI